MNTVEKKKLDLVALRAVAGGSYCGGYGGHGSSYVGGNNGNASASGLINIGSGNRS